MRIGGVYAYQEVRVELGANQPALVVVLIQAHAVAHVKRFTAGEDGGAGVALLIGAMPDLGIAGRVELYLPGLEFGFLQAQRIHVAGCEIVHEALAHASAQAVDVPGSVLHMGSSLP